ncbi:hypothetical protein GZ78_17095 [Endozoicomonas numazuensis]|uniref:Uncharacterized protein n=1 Tax=Endozoicomonas numazuensis TaxID=1137799 RepID=A0A081NGA8_9GAMM|nr:hypothetical protein GZ78_17095 [Endozoicomonas numazuensis]
MYKSKTLNPNLALYHLTIPNGFSDRIMNLTDNVVQSIWKFFNQLGRKEAVNFSALSFQGNSGSERYMPIHETFSNHIHG